MVLESAIGEEPFRDSGILVRVESEFLCQALSFVPLLTFSISFSMQFDDFAHEIEEVSTHSALNVYQVAESFSISITSSALTLHQVFPNVTIPHFEVRGDKYRTATNVLLVSYSPIVTDLMAWNEYSLSAQSWINESYQFRGESALPTSIEEMYSKNEHGNHVVEQDGQEVYSPLWMEAPAPIDTEVLNFNLLSEDLYGYLFETMRNTSSPVLSPIIDPAVLLGDGAIFKTDDETLHPESLILQPVFDSFDVATRSVVGTVISVIPWDLFLSNLLHEGEEGVICVLQNSCGGIVTYLIEGRDATYLGEGDRHDPVYNYLERTFPFSPSVATDDHDHDHHEEEDEEDDTQDEYCRFTLHVFPTEQLEEKYRTSEPAKLTAAIVLIFAFTGVVFFYTITWFKDAKREFTQQLSSPTPLYPLCSLPRFVIASFRTIENPNSIPMGPKDPKSLLMILPPSFASRHT